MKLLVACDAHIYETPDGKHWTPAIYGYTFWKRYINNFNEIRIVARTKKVPIKPEKSLLVDGPGIEIFPIPFYQGPRQLLKKYISIKKKLKNVENGCDVALFRMPSQTAQMTYESLTKAIPVAGEIVYDPSDDLKNSNKLSTKIINIIISNKLKRFCKKANGVSYVTSETIQKKYPSTARIKGESKKYFETYYSTITLEKNAFFGPRDYRNKEKFTLCLSDVSMNSDRKGEKTLIEALKKVIEKGYNVSATIIGDGSKRKEFEEMVKKFNLSKNVNFTGRLSSANDVRKELINSDIFIFPTQAEGLPRGIIEAMAVGMPVLSTPVGGIPEIIDGKYLFNSKDSDSFANEICRLINNANELNIMSKNNYEKALEFQNEILQSKRETFYEKLKQIVQEKNK